MVTVVCWLMHFSSDSLREERSVPLAEQSGMACFQQSRSAPVCRRALVENHCIKMWFYNYLLKREKDIYNLMSTLKTSLLAWSFISSVLVLIQLARYLMGIWKNGLYFLLCI